MLISEVISSTKTKKRLRPSFDFFKFNKNIKNIIFRIVSLFISTFVVDFIKTIRHRTNMYQIVQFIIKIQNLFFYCTSSSPFWLGCFTCTCILWYICVTTTCYTCFSFIIFLLPYPQTFVEKKHYTHKHTNTHHTIS